MADCLAKNISNPEFDNSQNGRYFKEFFHEDCDYFDFCPAYFLMGANLTSSERTINSKRVNGIWIASLLKEFSGDLDQYVLGDKTTSSTVRDIGYCFTVSKDSRHFRENQEEWSNTARDLFTLAHGYAPNEDEFYHDYYIKHHNSERFRIWYNLNFPDYVELRTDLSDSRIAEAELFLKMAEKISGNDYWSYFKKRVFMDSAA